MKYRVCPVAKIAVRPKNGKGTQKLIDLPRKKEICIYVNKMDRHTASNKQEKCDEISNQIKNMSIKEFIGGDNHNPPKLWIEFDRVSWNERA